MISKSYASSLKLKCDSLAIDTGSPRVHRIMQHNLWVGKNLISGRERETGREREREGEL